MLKFKTKGARALATASGLGFIALAAMGAGLYTNGLPTIGAGTVNGSSVAAPNGLYGQLKETTATVGVDTNLASGANPQTVSASVAQIAAVYASMAGNTATSTVHAATLNTTGGIITTESLSTAAGSTYTFTLTNSQITSTSQVIPVVAMYSGTNTGGAISLTSVTAASGSATFVWTNTGTTAFNGTMLIAFHL